MKIRLLLLLTFLFSIVSFSQVIPPKLSNFRIESSQEQRIYFDSSKEITGSKALGFVVNNKSITGIKLNEGKVTGHYFTVSREFTFWDNNTIRYDGGADIHDVQNNKLESFSLEIVRNQIEEPQSMSYKYFVSVTGNDNNDGKSENSAWKTINKALDNAKPGATIWIKAGNYGDEKLRLKESGIINNPIKIIGYKDYPGDILTNYFDYGKEMDESKMPTLVGKSLENDDMFWLYGVDYVIIKNLQIKNANYGIRAGTNGKSCNNIVIENYNGYKFGNKANEHASAISFQTTNGKTFAGSQNIRIRNSVIVNSSMHNLVIFGDGNNLVENVKTYNDRLDIDERSDYQISLNGDNNIISNCYSENFNNTETNVSTHGIGIRGQNRGYSNYNLIVNCEAINMQEGLYIRNFGCEYNVIRNGIVRNNGASSYEDRGGVVIWGGSNYNIVENVSVFDVDFGIIFKDNQEDENKDTSIGHDNIIRNSNFYRTKYSIRSSGSNNSLLKDNKIYNCNFFDSEIFFREDKTSVTNLDIKNCNIIGVRKATHNSTIKGLNFTFSNFHNSWGKENGEGNVSMNPEFEDSLNGNFRLKSGSPLINKGKILDEVKFDIEGNNRPQGGSSDIGSFEYLDKSTSSVKANAGEDVIICLGEEVNLIAAGGNSYTWSTGATSSEIKVSPEKTTTYTVTVSDGITSDEDEVVVIVTEVFAFAGEDISINSGEEVVLTADGGDSYLWGTGETTQSITVSPIETQTYQVTVSSKGCKSSDQLTVTVINNETEDIQIVANAGEDLNICEGESVVLTASGGDNYSWSNGEVTNSIEVSPSISTRYVVIVSNGTSSDTDEVIVNVSSVQANAGSDITITKGESVKLSATGGSEYLWSNGGITSSIIVQPLSSTVFSVHVGNGTCYDIDEVKVNVENPVHNPNSTNFDAGEDQTICLGESLSLTAQGGNDYLWSNGESVDTIEVNPTRTQTYEVTASLNGINVSDTVTITVENCDSSYDEEIIGELDIQLYPNPTTGLVKIQSTFGNMETNIYVININGKILHQETLKSGDGIIEKQIDLSNYTKGIYFFRFYSQDEQMVKKVVLI